MSRWLRTIFPVAVFLSICTLFAAAPAGIELVAKGTIPGTSLDKSGLTGLICPASGPAPCISKAAFGGLGSALAYSGLDDVFIAAPDRGPFDGLTDVPFLDRVHFLHITTNLQTKTVSTTLLDTRVLKNEFGQQLLGAAGAFDTVNPFATLRFDPEGIRVGATGTLYISDEYGPYVFEFDRQGNLLRRIELPSSYAIENPSAIPNDELLNNTSGRQANRGMEGLAISPDGSTLFGMMQNALLQDNALTPGTVDRQSVFTRIIKIDLATGGTQEYVYQLDAFNRGQGVSEILAINNHEFLVIERDNRSWSSAEPQAPTRKWIYRINISGATDISGRTEPLPAAAPLPAGVTPVQKSVFINLLEPDFGLHLNNATAIAEKIEGLAWGPDLPDGKHLLYVISDNDLITANATQIFAFAIDDTKLATPLNLEPQVLLHGPMYPPGQLKKQIGR